jgi:hypothetical protein
MRDPLILTTMSRKWLDGLAHSSLVTRQLSCGFLNFLAGFFLFRMAGLADADDEDALRRACTTQSKLEAL